MTQDLALFQALGAKMNYLNQRQKVIAQNIANANTPGYRPNDLEKVDFGSLLKGIADQSPTATLMPVSTNPMHISAQTATVDPRTQAMKKTYDVAPAGNAVVMEEQMVNSAQTVTDYNLVTSLYEKNINMQRLAIGVAH